MATATATAPMTGAELYTIRESLGLSGDWLADHLEISPRSLRRYERGDLPVPQRVCVLVRALRDRTEKFIAQCAKALSNTGDPALTVYRTDEEYHWHHPEKTPLPASWHRTCAARIALQVPGLRIDYPAAQEEDR
jgi:transcriptional regulator with XRE-family HTH domain